MLNYVKLSDHYRKHKCTVYKSILELGWKQLMLDRLVVEGNQSGHFFPVSRVPSTGRMCSCSLLTSFLAPASPFCLLSSSIEDDSIWNPCVCLSLRTSSSFHLASIHPPRSEAIREQTSRPRQHCRRDVLVSRNEGTQSSMHSICCAQPARRVREWRLARIVMSDSGMHVTTRGAIDVRVQVFHNSIAGLMWHIGIHGIKRDVQLDYHTQPYRSFIRLLGVLAPRASKTVSLLLITGSSGIVLLHSHIACHIRVFALSQLIRGPVSHPCHDSSISR